MAWRQSGTKPISEPLIASLLTNICVARPQRVKPLVNLEQRWIITSDIKLIQIKENIKALRHWPLCGEFTGEVFVLKIWCHVSWNVHFRIKRWWWQGLLLRWYCDTCMTFVCIFTYNNHKSAATLISNWEMAPTTVITCPQRSQRSLWQGVVKMHSEPRLLFTLDIPILCYRWSNTRNCNKSC